MKKKSTIIGLVVLVLCLILCTVLLLSRCTGNESTDPTQPSQGSEPSQPESTGSELQPSETESQPTGDTEATDATDSTDSTDATESTQGGSSTPGGWGGFEGGGGNINDGSGTTPTPTEPEFPEPGTEANPYAEVLGELPDGFTTVSIPAGGSVSYRVFGAQGAVLGIPDADATLTVDGVTYTAEDGAAIFDNTADEGAAPLQITIGNTGEEEKAFTLEASYLSGTARNPITVSIDDMPYIAPELAPDQKLYFRAVGVSGATLTVSGGQFQMQLGRQLLDSQDGSVVVEGLTDRTVDFSLTNTAQVPVALTIDGFIPVGTMDNPAALELGDNAAVVGANGQPYYYSFTAPANGTLAIDLDGSSIANGWQYAFENRTTGVMGDLFDCDYTPDALHGEIEVAEGDEILLMVGTFDPADPYTAPEGQVGFNASFTEALGSRNNPILITDPTQILQANVPAGTIVWYQGRVGTLELTAENAAGAAVVTDTVTVAADANGKLSYIFPEGSFFAPPPVFGISNGTDTDAVYQIRFAEPLGSYGNPAEMVIGINTATVSANYDQGYNYVFNATEEGTLTVTMLGETWQYCYDYMSHFSDDAEETGVVTVAVQPGDQVYFAVNTYIPSEMDTPAGEVSFNASFLGLPGSFSNPLPIYSFPFTTDSIPAGQTVHYAAYNAGGKVLTVTDGAGVTVGGQAFENGGILPATGRGQATVIGITNSGSEASAFTLSLSSPLGALDNPDTIVIGTNTAQVSAGSWDGYIYNYTATEEGTLKLTFTCQEWVANLDGTIYASDDDGATGILEVQVVPGQKVELDVNTFGDAGQITFEASFVGLPGSSTNPLPIYFFPYTTEAIPAGQTVYYQTYNNVGGMILTVTDVAAVTVNGQEVANGGILPATGWGETTVFGVTNGSEAEAQVTLTLDYPVGHPENPAQLNLGPNQATVAADNADGYVFLWTAPGTGELTLSFQGSNWQYTINNLSSGVYGDLRDTSDEANALAAVEVRDGDLIQINVNAFDASDPYGYPGGTVDFTAAFAQAGLTPEDPIQLTPADFPYTVSQIAPGESLYFAIVRGQSDMVLEVSDGSLSLTVNDKAFTSGSAIGRPGGGLHNLVITNPGQETITNVALELGYPLGHIDNPDQFLDGGNTATVTDSYNGYHYTWTAADPGKVTVTVTGAEPSAAGWMATLDVLNTDGIGSYGDPIDSQGSTNSVSAQVVAGDQVQLTLLTVTGEPADVSFTFAFEADPGTLSNPIELTLPATDVAVEPGATVYYSVGSIPGHTLKVEGEGDFQISLPNSWWPSEAVNGVATLEIDPDAMEATVFSITNPGDTAATYDVSASIVYGTWKNPAPAQLGENEAVIQADSQDSMYYFFWNAAEDGELTLSVVADKSHAQWTYQVNNITGNVYGDSNDFNGETVNLSQTLTVSAGDYIEFCVGTLNTEGWDILPGTVVMDLAFTGAPGSQSNPIELSYYDFPVTGIALAPGQTVYYNAYNVGGQILTASEGVTVTVGGQPFENGGILPATAKRVPTAIAVTNPGSEAVTAQLALSIPLGSMDNPDTIVLGTNTAQVSAGSQFGYFYSYTATEEGTLTLTMLDEAWQYDYDNTPTFSDSEGATGIIEIPVQPGEEIRIAVNTYDPANPYSAPGGEFHFEASFVALPGSKSNPILIQDLGQPLNVAVPAGKTVYYTGRVGGMEVTASNASGLAIVTDGFTVTPDASGSLSYVFPDGGFYAPRPVFGICNGTDTVASYSLSFGFPLGHAENPAKLTIGPNQAAVAAGNDQGYIYQWTAPGTGRLTLTFQGTNWQYTVNNYGSYTYGDLLDASDEANAVAVVEVKAEDLIEINVNAFDASDPYGYPGGTVAFTAAFQELGLSADAPIELTPEDFPYIIDQIAPGQSIYFSINKADSAMLLSLDNETLTMTVNGEAFASGTALGRPVAGLYDLVVTNPGQEAASYAMLGLNLPLGHMDNQDTLVMDVNVANVTDTWNGYHYSWIAPDPGKLTITMAGSSVNTQGWILIPERITGEDTVISEGNLYSDTDSPVFTYEVEAGDRVHLVVIPLDENPGQVTFTASFEAPLGSQSNPIQLTLPAADVAVEAGQKVYYTVAAIPSHTLEVAGDSNDFTLSMGWMSAYAEEGVATLEIDPDAMEPAVFAIENTGDTAATYDISAYIVYGTWRNPAPAQLGENEAVIQANGQDSMYYFFYEAEEDGKLTLSIVADKSHAQWTYQVNNITGNVYGDSNDFNGEPVNLSQTLDVTAGDYIEFCVGTLNTEGWDILPGTVVMDLGFAANVGTKNNPIILSDLSQPITVEVAPGQDVYYQGMISGMDITIADAGAASIVTEGFTVAADAQGNVIASIPTAMGRPQPVIFAVHNGGQTHGTYTMTIAFPKGHSQNPDTLAMGSNAAVLQANNTDGYLYTWIAPENGVLTVEMAADNANGWAMTLNDLTSNSYGNNLFSAQGHAGIQIINVAAGDKLQLIVNTCNADPDVYDTPAGTVSFTASFQAGSSVKLLENKDVAKKYTMSVQSAAATADGEMVLVIKSLTNSSSGAALAYTMKNNVSNASASYQAGQVAIGHQQVAEGGTAKWTLSANYTVFNFSYELYFIGAAADTTEPDATEPDTTEPDTTEPDTTEPDTTEPDTTEPDATEPDTTEPGNSGTLKLGANTATVEAGTAGAALQWTAPQQGLLTVTMDDANASGWQLQVNSTARASANTLRSCDGAAGIFFLNVQAGDPVTVTVNTCAADGTAPAGTVSFQASFEAGRNVTVMTSQAVENQMMAVTMDSGVSPADGEMVLTVSAPVNHSTGAAVKYRIDNSEQGKISYTAGTPAIQRMAVTSGQSVAWSFINLIYTPLDFNYEILLITGETQTTEPDATEPDTTEPDTTEPDATEPDTTEPDATDPIVPDAGSKTLVLGTNTATVAANDADGLTFHWNATGNGVLTLDMGNDNANGWSFTVTNVTAGTAAQSFRSADLDPGYAAVNVSTGDQLQVVVNTCGTGTATPAGTVSFVAGFVKDKVVEVLKAETLLNDWNHSISTGTLDHSGEMILLVSNVRCHGASPATYPVFRLTAPGEVKTSYSARDFAVSRLTVAEGDNLTWSILDEADLTYIDLDYQLLYIHRDLTGVALKGSQENPRVVTELAGIPVELPQNDTAGCYYSCTAPSTGYFCLTASASMLDVTVTNKATGEAATLWVGDRSYAPVAVRVSSGQELEIFVKAHTPGQAVSTQLNAEVTPGNTVEGLNIAGDCYGFTMNADEKISFFCRWQGRTLTFRGTGFTLVNLAPNNVEYTYTDEDGDGVISFVPVANGDTAIITVQNTGAAPAAFTMEATYPLGTPNNPQAVAVGSHVLENGGGSGWYYSYTPEADGVLCFTVDEANAPKGWHYQLGSDVNRYSSDGTYKYATQYILVRQGEPLRIFLSTLPATSGQTTTCPDGAIGFSLSLVQGMGTAANPIPLYPTMSTFGGTGEIAPGATVYFALPANTAGKQLNLSLSGYGQLTGITALVNGQEYTGDWSIEIPALPAAENGLVIFALRNDGDACKRITPTVISE